MTLDAGRVEATLGFRVDDRGRREFDRKVEEAGRKHATAKLDLDVDDKRADAFQTKLTRITKKQAVRVGLDERDLRAVETELNRRIKNVQRQKARFVIDADTVGIKRAERELGGLRRDLVAVSRQRAEIKVDVDRSAWDRFKATFSRDSASLGSGGGGRRGGGGLLLGLGGTGGSGRLVSALAGHSLPALAAAAAVAEGALAALAASALALGGALAPLVGVLAAIPAALTGLGQVAGSLFATFKGIPDAVKALGDASTKSAVDDTAALEQQKAATEAVQGAKTGLANTQRQALFAQEALTAARKDAVRTLTDMRNQARDAALAEQSSALAVREAQQELRRVTADPKSTGLDIERAQLGLKQARQDAREARIEAQRAERDNSRAQAGGVERVPQVVQARRQLAEANHSVTESTRALARAQEQAASGSAKLSSSQQKLQDEMSKLSPAGQRFARFLHSLTPAFDRLRAASQQAALPHFQRGIEGAMRNLPLFQRLLTNTSRIMGTATERFGKFLGGREAGRDIEIIGRTNNNVLRNLGRAVVPLTKAFNDVGVAAAPFTRWLGRITLHLARLIQHSAKAGRESGGLAAFLHRTRNVMESLGRTIVSLTKGFGGLFGASFGAGKDFLGLMERLSARFDEWANSARGQNSIKKFLEDAKEPLRALGDALVSVLKLIKDLIAAPGSGEGFKLFVRSIDLMARGLDALTKVPLVGGFLGNLALMAVIAGRFGKLGAAISGLKNLAGGIRGVTAAQAEADAAGGFGGPMRKLGLALRDGATKIGTQMKDLFRRVFFGAGQGAATGASEGAGGLLGSRMGRAVRRGLSGIRNIFMRLFGRAGEAAAAEAAGTAAGGMAGAAAPGGKLGKQSGKFRALGRGWGAAAGLGMVAGLVAFGPDIAKWLKSQVDESLVTFGLKSKPKSNVGGLPRGSKLLGGEGATLDQYTVPKNRNPIGTSGQQERERDRQRREQERARARRVQTVEVDPVVGVAGLPTARGVRRQMDRVGDVVRREFGQLSRLLERLAKRLDDPFRNLHLLRGRDPLGLEAAVRRSGEDAEGVARRWARKIGEAFESISRFARIEGRETGESFADGLGDSARSAERRIGTMRERLAADFRAISRVGSSEARELVANMRDTFGRLDSVVAGPTGKMLRIVATALRTLGASGAAKITATAEKITGRAFGGTVPGYSTQDDHIVAVRGGEAVLRPEDHVPFVQRLLAYTKAQGVQPFNSLGEMFQRTGGAFSKGGMVQGFAKGGQVPEGIVPIPGQPGESIHSSILKQVQTLIRRYKLKVTDGYAPSGHAAGGEHPKGLAIDVVPGQGGSWGRVDKLAAWAEPTQGSPRGPFRWVGYTGDPGHGRGNHLHLSWGGKGSVATAPRVRARTGGRTGAVRDMVRGGLQAVERASNRRIDRAEGAPASSGPVGKGGPAPKGKVRGWLTQALKLTGHLSPRNLNALYGRAIQESAGNPRAINLWDSNAKAGHPSKGLIQTIDSTFNAYKLKGHDNIWNPVDNAAAAIRYMFSRYGGIVGPSGSGYARGGFVGRTIQALASGGFASGGMVGRGVRAAGAAVQAANRTKPRTRKSGPKAHRPGKVKSRRVPHGFGIKYLEDAGAAFERLTDENTGTIARLTETYDVDASDADLTTEEYNDSDTGAIRWDQVEKRLAEVRVLQADVNAITAEIDNAIGIATRTLGQITLALKALRQRRQAILDRVKVVVARVKSLAESIKEKAGKKKYADQVERWRGQLNTYRGELQALTGDRQGKGAGGELGDVTTKIGGAEDGGGLLGLQSALLTGLQSLQGATGRAGLKHQYANIFKQLESERVHDLGDSLKATGASATTGSGAQEIQSFLSSLGDLRKQFGNNFRPLNSFAGGGRVPGPLGMPQIAEVHGGELITDPRTGAQKVVVEIKRADGAAAGSRTVNIENNFAGPPLDPHTWTRQQRFEVGAI